MSPPSPVHDLPAKPLILRNLGGLALESRGGVVRGAGLQPARLVLVSVIARSGTRGVTRDRLHAWFWPESDSERARNALNQALYALRRDVGEQELTLGTSTLRLNPAVVESDVELFERALDAGQLEAAVDLYGGPFLDGVHLQGSDELEHWIEEQRHELAIRHGRALEQLARDAEARGDARGAVIWWQRLASADPLNSRIALGLGRALAAAGDPSRALVHAARHEERLRRELDLAPPTEFAVWVDDLRAGRITPARPRVEPSAGVTASPGSVTLPDATTHPVRRRGIGALVVGGGLMVAALLFAMSRLGGERASYRVGRATSVTVEPGLEIEPSLSPDGRLVAYAAGPLPRTRVYVRQPGGRPIPVTPDSGYAHRRPLWSPDGTQLLVALGDSVENGLNYGIAVVPALGGNLRVLVPRGVESAAWAPDSRQIAFVQTDTLYVRSIVSGPPRALTGYQDMHALAWSPDGRWIAMAAGNSLYDTWGLGSFGDTSPSELLVVSALGGKPVLVAAAGSLNASPVWTPDSRRLLFVSNRDGPRDVYVVSLTEAGRPRGDPVRLTTGLSAHSIALSADGRRLAYSAYYEQANIWALPIRADSVMTLSSAVPVTTGSQVIEALSISRDGKRLYFDSHHEGTSDIYRLMLPDGPPVPLTHDPTDEFGPAESPDGRWVAFHSRHHGTRDIMVMPAAGGDPLRVTSDPGEERFPWWSPDGRSLTYALLNASERNGRYLVSRAGDGGWGSPRRIGSMEPAATACWVQDWTPDEGSFLCGTDGQVRALPAGEGEGRVYYSPRNTDDPRATQARSLRDGRNIVFRSHDDRGRTFFWLIPGPDRRPRLLAKLDDPDRPAPRQWFATDGRRLYFTIHDRQSDVYVAELSAAK